MPAAASKNWRGCWGARRSPMAFDGRRVRCLRRRPSARVQSPLLHVGRKAKAKVRGESESSGTLAKKYLIETFGCQMNVHDSERMAGLLEQAGYEATGDAADADVVVINTCSVRERAEEKLYTRLGELRQLAAEQGHDPIVAVAGCVAQQEGEAMEIG